MKKIITSLLLASVVLTPALASAATRHQDVQQPSQAQASAIPSDAVAVDGNIVGQDPDPSVRAELARDAYSVDR